jgi:transposase
MTEIFTKERIDKIRNNLYFSGERYFDENINISLHIRTANPDDIPAEIVSTYREKYIFEKDFHRYKNLVDFLKNNTKDKKATLHIHSQGFTTNFEEFFELKEENFDIKLHIDDHPISDIYHMVNADLLIMSNSSFSWLSSLLNSNQKIARDNFMNGPFVHNCLKANYDYSQIS